MNYKKNLAFLCYILSFCICYNFAFSAPNGSLKARNNDYVNNLRAKQVILLDATTGTVLLEKNSNERMGPSSMTKLMTSYLAFEKIKHGSLNWQSRFIVSKRAMRPRVESIMYLREGENVSVEDLVKGIIIVSANDGSIVLAEGASGTESQFAQEMTEKAYEIGAVNSSFKNASGIPDPEHYSTARDIAIISLKLMQDFPEYYHLFSITELTHNSVKQTNMNPLLYVNDLGADGLKTGRTEAAGFGLAASAEKDGQRLVLVINGLRTARERAAEAEAVMRYGFREFGTYKLFKAHELIDQAKVWLGENPTVALISDRDIAVTLRRKDLPQMKVKVVYNLVEAPIQIGSHVADLHIGTDNQEDIAVFPLFAAENVESAGLVRKLYLMLNYLLFGKI